MKKLNLHHIFLLGAIMLICNFRTYAQVPDTLQVIDLEKIVVSANRFSEPARKVPYQVISITGARTAQLNAPTTAEVLQNTGMVFVQKSQMGGGSPVLRGLEANRVLLVVDGVRLNNAIYRAGHLQNCIAVDHSVLSKTEIIMGSNSVMYGSDALGGVIHFYTKNPLLQFYDEEGLNVKGNAYARYATANQEKTAHIDLNIGGKKFGSLTAITATNFDDLKQGAKRTTKYPDFGKKNVYVKYIDGKDSVFNNPNPNIQTQSGYSQIDILQKFRYKASEKINHVLNLQYSNSTNVPRYDRLTETNNNTGKPSFADWYYGPQKRLMASYQLTHTPTIARLYNKTIVTVAYQNIDESRHSRSLNSSKLKNQIENVQLLTLNADAEKYLNSKKTSIVRYGAEIAHNIVDSKAYFLFINTADSTAPTATRYPDGGSTLNTAALYTSFSNAFFNDKLLLNTGLRYNYITLNAIFNNKDYATFPFNTATQKNFALCGNLSLTYLPSPVVKIATLFSTGFRAPNVDDLGKVFDSKAGTVIIPNPNLKPEYTYNAELNTEFNLLDNNLILQLSGFYTLLKNAIVIGNTQLNGADSALYDGTMSKVKASQNQRQATIKGFSASINVPNLVIPNLQLSAQITQTIGNIQTDTTEYPLDHIPPTFGRVGLMYQPNMQRLQVETWLAFNGAKKLDKYNLEGEDNEKYATAEGALAWQTLNARASYKVTKNIELQANIENILDTNYRLFASGISSAGRNFIGTLRLKW